jgi:small subunit ribosomal protein S10
MVQKARIRLTSINQNKLEDLCNEIKDIASKTGVKLAGPIPLPTKHLTIPTRKTPCGQGTPTWDKYEMRIHKRLIDVEANERAMRRVMRLKVPDEVFIEITLI